MKSCALFLAMGAVILMLSGCLIMPFPHADLESVRYSGRVLDASTRRPIGGAEVMVAGLPKTGAETDSSGRFLTREGIAWMLVSEGTPGGDMGIGWGGQNEGCLLVTHGGYRQGKVNLAGNPEDLPLPIFLGGTDFKPEPVGDILLRREQ